MDTLMERGLSSPNRASKQELLLFGPNKIAKYWPQIEQALDVQPELWNVANTKDSLLDRALAGHIQVWALDTNGTLHVVFFTQLYRTITTTIFQIFWAYGERLVSSMPFVNDVFDNFAAQQGASRIEVQGRKGFEPLLKKLGYGLDYVTYTRPVSIQRGN